MADLLNVSTKQSESIPEDQIYQVLAAGTHTPSIGQKILLSPDGQLVFSAAHDVSENIDKYGYKIPTQEELNALAQHEQFGEGAGNLLKAGALGAARGATLGLSDLALAKSGAVSPETIKGLQEENPITSTGSEIAGAVGASALMPESLPGRAAKASEKIAEGAHAVLGAGAKAAAKEGSLAAKVLGASADIGAKGLGSAVEGGLYGLGQSVSEYSMGDPDLNGEKVLANLGYGALYGGGLGAMLKAGSMGIPASVEKAQQAFGGLYEKYVGKTTELPGPFLEGAPVAKIFEPGIASKAWAKAASAVGGEPEEEIVQKMIDARNPAKRSLSVPEMRQLAEKQNGEIQHFYDSVSKASRDFTPARKEEINALLEEAPVKAPLEQLEKNRGALNNAIAEMKAEPALYPPRYARELELLRDHINNALYEPKTPEALFKRETPSAVSYSKEALPGSEPIERHLTGDMEKPLESLTAADIHETLNEVKQKLGEIVPRGDIAPADGRAINLIKGVQSGIRSGLEHAETWGDAAARQQAINEAITQHIAADANFRSEFMKKVKKPGYGSRFVVNPTKTQSWFNMINDPRGAIKTSALRDYLKASRNLVDEMGKTYEHAPFSSGAFEKDDLQSLLQKGEQNISRMRNTVQAQPGGHGFVTDALTLGGAGILGGPGAFMAALGHKAFSMAHNPSGAIEKLVKLEKAANKATRFINTSAKAAVDITREATKGVSGAGAVGAIISPEERRQRFEKRSEEILDRNVDPDKAIDHMVLATADGFHAAPNVMGSIQQASLRGTSFLAGKIPKQPVGPTLFSPGAKIPMADIIKFDRYYETIHDPLSVMTGLRHNRLHPESMEALLAVYPKLYQEMASTVFSALSAYKAKSDKLIPYQKRLALCQFLGSPLDSGMNPQFMASNQQTLAGIDQENEAKEAAQKDVNFTISNRTKTDFQEDEDDA